MTVAVGFHCTDGVVLAADSEISNAYMKYQGDKAWVYKYPRDASAYWLQLGIVGAGDAAFIQYASGRIDAAMHDLFDHCDKPTMDDGNSVVQGVLNDIHHRARGTERMQKLKLDHYPRRPAGVVV